MTVAKHYHWKHGWIPLDHFGAVEAPKKPAIPPQRKVPGGKLLDALKSDGGFTYNPKTAGLLEVGKVKGFAVALPGTETVVGEEKVGGEDISREDFAKGVQKVIMAHREEIAQGAVLGGWYSPERNQYMVELTQVVPSKSAAINLGKGRNQEAIFDLGSGETINTGGTGDLGAPKDRVPIPKVYSTFVAEPTEEEKAAAKYYTGPGFQPLNNSLRFGSPMPLPVQDRMHKLDAVLAKSVVPQDMTVYRGVQDGSWLPRGLAPGTLIEDKGYISTAADPAGEYGGNTTMVVNVPKGMHALDLNGNALTHHPGEAELLLPRGTKLRVVADDVGPDRRIIHAEVVV